MARICIPDFLNVLSSSLLLLGLVASVGGAAAPSGLAVDGTIRLMGAGLDERGFSIGRRGVTLEAAANTEWTLQFSADAPIRNAASGPLVLTGEGIGQLDKVIPGAASTATLTKSGSGTWTLINANTYRGATAINAGTLLIAGAGTLGDGIYAAPITNDSVLVFDGFAEQALTGCIDGRGRVVQSGIGTLTLLGTNTYSAGTTLDAGTLVLAGASAIGTGPLTIRGGTLDSVVDQLVNVGNNAQEWLGDFAFRGTQDLDLGSGEVTVGRMCIVTVRTNSLTVGGVISGESGLIKRGAGTLALTADNSYSYSGPITIDEGTLVIGAGGDSGAPGTGNLFVNADLIFNRSDAPTFRGTLIGNGGTVTQVATNTVTFLGDTTLNGPLTLAANARGTLLLGGLSETKQRSTVALNGQTLTVSGAGNTVIEGYGEEQRGALIKTGSGTLTLASDLGLRDSNVSVQGGVLRVQGSLYSTAYTRRGVLRISDGAAFELSNWNYGDSSLGGLRANSNAMVVNNGTIRMTGSDSYFRGITVNGGGATLDVAAGASWTIGFIAHLPWLFNDDPTLTFTGAGTGRFEKVFYGGGCLIKSGVGSWTLTAANTYTGATLISNGTLRVDGSLASSGTVSVCTGGALEGSGTVGSIEVMPGGIVAPGSDDPGALHADNVTLGAGTLAVEIDGTNCDRIAVSGTFDASGANLKVTGRTGQATSWTIVTGTIEGRFDTINGLPVGDAAGADAFPDFTVSYYPDRIDVSIVGEAEARIVR